MKFDKFKQLFLEVHPAAFVTITNEGELVIGDLATDEVYFSLPGEVPLTKELLTLCKREYRFHVVMSVIGSQYQQPVEPEYTEPTDPDYCINYDISSKIDGIILKRLNTDQVIDNESADILLKLQQLANMRKK